MNKKDKQDLMFAADYYLYKDLPNNFDRWSDKKLFKFIEESAWQPFEYWEGEKLWYEIEKLANGVREYIKENK